VVAVSVFRAHAAHFIVFGLPVIALVATVGWQELRTRWTTRGGRHGSGSDPQRSGAARPLDRESIGLRLASVGLFVSALLHASVIREHFREYFLYGMFFTLLATAQAVLGMRIAVRPKRATVRAVAATSVWVVVLWLASRTTGLPIGPEPWRPEAYGAFDVAASCAELVTAIGCWSALHHWSMSRRVVGRTSVVL
jgi:hypothetical protein